MARLGGTVLSTESAGEFSSAAKGETLQGGPATSLIWLGAAFICFLHAASERLPLCRHHSDSGRVCGRHSAQTLPGRLLHDGGFGGFNSDH